MVENTKQDRLRPPCDLQLTYEKLLRWAALILVEYHMLVCSFREILPGYGEPLYRYEKWFGLLLVIALVIYLLVSMVLFPRTMWRIQLLLRRLVSYEQLYMVWVFIWYIVSCTAGNFFIGGNFFRGNNDWWLFMTGLMAFVLFPLGRFLGSNRAKRVIDPMLKIILIPHIMVWGWALERYLYRHVIYFPSGGKLDVVTGGAMSFGYNQNITGAGAAIMLGLCLYMVVTQKSWRKIYYGVGGIVYLGILTLTNCRTSWYAAALMMAVASFLVGWYGLEKRGWLTRIGSGILLVVICIVTLHGFRIGMFALEEKTWTAASETRLKAMNTEQYVQRSTAAPVLLSSGASGSISPENSNTGIKAKEMAVKPRVADGNLTGRIPLYKACLQVMFSRKYCFLFGVTPDAVGQVTYGYPGVNRIYGHAHNFILQMGISYGVPTMLATVVFLISILVRCLRVLFLSRKKPFAGFWALVPVVLFLISEDMMESYLNVSAWSMTCSAFYLFAGWITAMDFEDLQAQRKEGYEVTP